MLDDLFDLTVENNSSLDSEHQDQDVESRRTDPVFRRRLLDKVIRNMLTTIENSTRSRGVLISDPRAPIRLDADLCFQGPAEDGGDDSDTVKPVIEQELTTLGAHVISQCGERGRCWRNEW
ncbi:hypothetical protein [Amycolatopsis thailandensis]|uniref:hypothetical protein n=1 Tax=Amycolatopsis thailandensis TaxID=589330 RepID=UPI0036352067